MRSVVYFVGTESVHRVKIGTSTNLVVRLDAIRTHSPVSLPLVLAVDGGLVLERKLHRQFAAARSHGEWFSGTPALREFLDDIVRSGRDVAAEIIGNSNRRYHSAVVRSASLGQRLFFDFVRNQGLSNRQVSRAVGATSIAHWLYGRGKPGRRYRERLELCTNAAVPATSWDIEAENSVVADKAAE